MKGFNATVYTITTERKGHTNTYTGTLKHLVDSCFGYTIECNGHKKETKTLASLLNKLNGGASYWSKDTSYSGRKATVQEASEFFASQSGGSDEV